MSKYTKKRKKQAAIKLVIVIALLIMVLANIININLDRAKKEQDSELKAVVSKATNAWSDAYKRGKKSQKDLELYVLTMLEKDGIAINNYYITVTETGVTVAKKPQGLLVEPGYYKAGTSYTEMLKSWEQLENEKLARVQRGKLQYCKPLEYEVDVVLPDSVTEIGEKVFYQSELFNSIVVPDSVINISDNAFSKSQIKEISLGKGIKSIGEIFDGMEYLETLLFTSSTTEIADDAFSDIKALKEVWYIGDMSSFFEIRYHGNDSVPTYNMGAMLYINGILVNELVIPEGIEKINDYALYNYTNIRRITVPKTVTEIGVIAFANTPIDTIVYNGTKQEWRNILKHEAWDGENKSYIVYCTDGKIENKGIDKK